MGTGQTAVPAVGNGGGDGHGGGGEAALEDGAKSALDIKSVSAAHGQGFMLLQEAAPATPAKARRAAQNTLVRSVIGDHRGLRNAAQICAEETAFDLHAGEVNATCACCTHDSVQLG